MQRKVSVILIGNAEETYEKLVKSNNFNLIKSLNKKIEILKLDPTHGDKIPKNLIPPTLVVSNLFRIELTDYWRMLYTIAINEFEIVCFVVEILDHDKYNQLFGYRKN